MSLGGWSFTVLGITPTAYAAAPELSALLRIEAPPELRVHAMALRAQVRIEPQRRTYDADEEPGLRALFGDRHRWGETLKPFQWMQCHATVPGFSEHTDIELSMPCTYDFDVTGSHYLHGVRSGTVPLTLMFSGTVFTRGDRGFAVQQVPWDSEARYDLPVAVWQEMMSLFFPGSGWIRLDHDVLARLGDYRARHGLVSWEETVTRLLGGVPSATRPVGVEEATP